MKEILISELDVSPTKMWRGVALFDISDSYCLLRACEESDIAILGIEGFRSSKGCRVPDMECIADFSGLGDSSGAFSASSREAAKKFIDDLVFDDLYLGFVLVKL